MNLPPKIIRQQITWKRTGTEKVPLSSARPVINTMPEVPPPPQGLNSRLRPAITPSTPTTVPTEVPLVSSTASVAQDEKSPATPGILDPVPSAVGIRNESPAKVVSAEIDKSLNNLPILSAFQEFLDNERERTRKRLIVMSVSYLLALILILAVSFTGGMIMLKSLRKDFQNMQTELGRLQSLSLKAKTDAETLSERLSKETIKIRTELGSSADETAGKLQTRVTAYDEKLTIMEKQVQALMTENVILKENLTSLQAGWLGLTNRMLSSSGKTDTTLSQSQLSNTPAGKPGTLSIMVMSMKPAGLDHSMEWRIPIPE